MTSKRVFVEYDLPDSRMGKFRVMTSNNGTPLVELHIRGMDAHGEYTTESNIRVSLGKSRDFEAFVRVVNEVFNETFGPKTDALNPREGLH